MKKTSFTGGPPRDEHSHEAPATGASTFFPATRCCEHRHVTVRSCDRCHHSAEPTRSRKCGQQHSREQVPTLTTCLPVHKLRGGQGCRATGHTSSWWNVKMNRGRRRHRRSKTRNRCELNLVEKRAEEQERTKPCSTCDLWRCLIVRYCEEQASRKRCSVLEQDSCCHPCLGHPNQESSGLQGGGWTSSASACCARHSGLGSLDVLVQQNFLTDP